MQKATSLAILQQSEYDLPRWKAWLRAHKHENQEVTPTEWTPKLKLINTLSSILFFLPQTLAISLAVTLTLPLEGMIRRRAYASAQKKLRALRLEGLKVVAIAGSYGKTSTKTILAHTLSGTHQVLVTPKSINTMLGVAQVIEQDLKPEHTLFVVELGEYHPGDIAQLCNFIQPDFGVLTPIGRQHLEILGSYEAVVQELRGLVTYFKHNLELVLVHELNRSHCNDLACTYYGEAEDCAYRILKAEVSRAGTECIALVPEEVKLFSPLFGSHQAVNTLPSFWLAPKIGGSVESVKKKVATLPYVHRRHEPTFAPNDVLILDNSYNTNADSIKASLALLDQLRPTRSLIVTLGFTETGDAAQALHEELGRLLASHVEYVGLIKAPWTDAIIEGFVAGGGSKARVVVGANQDEAFTLLQQYIIPGAVILFEGGYQEIYV